MDKQYYATVPQLIGMIIMLVGLLIINNISNMFFQTEIIYVISLLINLILLLMMFSNIFSILFTFALWETEEINKYYKLINIIIFITSCFIPVVVVLFGINTILTTENQYMSNLISYTSRCISH